MQSQKLAPSIRDMLVSKGSDGGNIFDELPGQHTNYVSKLVSRMLMVILLTLPAPNFRCNFSRIYQTPWGWREAAQACDRGQIFSQQGHARRDHFRWCASAVLFGAIGAHERAHPSNPTTPDPEPPNMRRIPCLCAKTCRHQRQSGGHLHLSAPSPVGSPTR